MIFNSCFCGIDFFAPPQRPPAANPPRPAPPRSAPARTPSTFPASGSTAVETQFARNHTVDGGRMKCRCDVPAIQLTVTRETVHKGKKFWKCGNDGACEFFEWDEPLASSSKVIPAKRSGPVSICGYVVTCISYD
jgi:DNA topoisomerase III